MKLSSALVWVCIAMGAAFCVAEEDKAAFASKEPSAGEREGEPLAGNMPPEWFAPPKTASELGIAQFSQSPLPDGRDLPPVGERLPHDPVVSHPYERIGHYGGKARAVVDAVAAQSPS